MSNDWDSGLCGHVCGGDCGTCLGAWFCSCFLYGRTAQRLDQFPDPKEPELFDVNCAIMCLAGCFSVHFIPALMKRMDVRRKFGIKGDACSDCLASCCCFPCTLAQMETQVKGQSLKATQNPVQQGYAPQPQGMVYEAPQHQQHQQYQQQQGYVYGEQPQPKY